MTVSITANLASQYAQSSIKTRSDAVNSDTLQLSSGLRVFSAVQDSAALAVGAGLKIDNAGLASAKINAGEANSMLQIADGALATASDIIVRLQSLAVQASSGQLSDSGRVPVNLEYQSLLSELNRLAGATSFNGVNLLNGQPNYSLTNASSQAANGVTGVAFTGTITGNPTLRYSYDQTTEKMTLTRTDGATTSTQTLDLTAIMDNAAGTGNNLSNGGSIQLNFNQLGVTLTLGSGFNRSTGIAPSAVAAPGAGGTLGTATAFVPATTDLDGDGVAGLLALAGGYNSTTGALTLPVATTVGSLTLGPLAGVSYAVNGNPPTASGAASDDMTGANTTVDIYVDGAGGPEKIGTVNVTGATVGTAIGAGTLVVSAGQGLTSGALQTANAATQLNYKIGTGIIIGQDLLQVSIPPVNSDSLGLSTTDPVTLVHTVTDVSTEANANNAINALQAALGIVSNARATVGAQQSRLSQVVANIDVFSQNNETARSALVDVDVPSTITELSNNQAMLQAGIAMLAQSNKIPSMLLNLLQN